jgi:hypothetical protein
MAQGKVEPNKELTGSDRSERPVKPVADNVQRRLLYREFAYRLRLQSSIKYSLW